MRDAVSVGVAVNGRVAVNVAVTVNVAVGGNVAVGVGVGGRAGDRSVRAVVQIEIEGIVQRAHLVDDRHVGLGGADEVEL